MVAVVAVEPVFVTVTNSVNPEVTSLAVHTCGVNELIGLLLPPETKLTALIVLPSTVQCMRTLTLLPLVTVAGVTTAATGAASAVPPANINKPAKNDDIPNFIFVIFISFPLLF